jgi:hypothetical protein
MFPMPMNQDRPTTGRNSTTGQYAHFENGGLTEDLVKEVAAFLFRVGRRSVATARILALWADELVTYRDAKGVLMGLHGFRFQDVGQAPGEYRVIYTVFSVVDERADNARNQVGQVGVRVYGRERQRRPRLPIVWASLAVGAAGQAVPGGMQDARRLVAPAKSTLPHTMRFFTDAVAAPGESDTVPAAAENAVIRFAEEQRGLEVDAQMGRPVAESRWKRVLFRAGSGLAVAGAFALIISNTFLSNPSMREGIGLRTKGNAALHIYRHTEGGSEELPSGAKFSTGDHLRFVVDLPVASRVEVVGVQADGKTYAAWPLPGVTASTVLPSGNGQALEGAVRLDASTGREMLYLVTCAPEVAAVQCRGNGPGTAPTCAPGCSLAPFALDKAGK